MMKKFRILGAVLILTAGCSAPRHLQKEAIGITLQSSPYVTVESARIRRDGEALLVTGTVRRMGEVHAPGHVHLTILESDGQTVATHIIRVPGLRSKRGGVQRAPFRPTFSESAGGDRTAVFRYHSGTCPG